MTVATAIFGKKKAATPADDEATNLPTFAGLKIDVQCPLESDVQSDLDEFHNAGCKFEKRVSGLHESRARLLAAAENTVLGVTITAAKKLNVDRARLQTELADLRWRKFELLPKLLPACKAAATEAAVEYERTLQSQIDCFEDMGVGVGAMPAADSNPKAAEIQLRHRAAQELGCLQAKQLQNQADEALRVLVAMIPGYPRPADCVIGWQAVAVGLPAQIATLVGLNLPSTPAPLDLSERARKIVRELQLTDAALLPSHLNIIQEIDAAMPAGGDVFRPLSAIHGKVLADVRDLISRWPATVGVKQWLHSTANGQPRHRI